MSSEMRELMQSVLDFVNRQPCRCMSIAQLGERDYCDRCQSVKNLRAILARTEAGAVKCSDCDGDGETCLAGRSAHRSNWIKCAKCNGTGDAAPVADGLYAWVRESPRHWERVTESDLSQPADPQKMRAGGWFPVYTHPQDASGDAERHELLRQVYGMAREGCESPMAGYRWCERIDELFHAGKPSDEYAEYASDLPDAMQAKEAK